jgi:hypothetical protein
VELIRKFVGNLYRKYGWELDVKMNITGRGWELVE